MAISPNYSWPLPDDSDLVKNGAEAIRDLGNAIDNTVDNLPSGALVHIETETIGSGVSAVSVNDCFSATFSNYLIRIRAETSASTTINMRMRVAGADNSTANYNTQQLLASAGSVTGPRVIGGTSFNLTSSGDGQFGFDISVFTPFEIKNTLTNGITGNGGSFHIFGAGFNATTSFTGFTIFPNTGTFNDGQIQVYGLKE